MNLPTIALPKIASSFVSSRVTILVAPIGAIAVSVVVLVFVVWPKFNQVLALNSENKQLEVLVKNLEVKASKLASLDKEQLDMELGASEQLLPSDKAVFSIVSQIEKAAGGSGVVLSKIDASPGAVGDSTKPQPAQGQSAQTPGDPTTKVQVKVSVSSDYKSLISFLSNILALPRAVVIRDVSISASSGSQIKTTLTVDAFWQVLPKDLGPVDSPIADLTSEEDARLKKIAASGTSVNVLPQVPTGRSDLFAPF